MRRHKQISKFRGFLVVAVLHFTKGPIYACLYLLCFVLHTLLGIGSFDFALACS